MLFKGLISGAVMLALTFVFIYFGGYALAVMLLFLSEVAFFELGRALKIFEGRQNALMIYGYIAVAAYYFGFVRRACDNRIFGDICVFFSEV